MNKWRRYLYLLVDDLKGTYPLRRIDASSLFLSKNQVNQALAVEETPPPRTTVSFTPSRDRGRLEFLGFFGRGPNRSHLAAVDYYGLSHTYDVGRRTMHEIASPNHCKFSHPVSLAVGEALYVMDREAIPGSECGFEVLTLDGPDDSLCKPNSRWHCLQPLPFVLDPGYTRRFIGAYTGDGGSNILISTPGIGTYSFDTSSCSWRKAGDWELPFCGRADFFPEHDITASAQGAPTLDMVWEDLDPPLSWVPLKSHLVYLGANQFCVAKFFERVFNAVSDQVCIPQIERFVVFTGLELKPTTDQRALAMLKHRTRVYRFEGITTCWVF
ncbi:unnamed protein product [Urochloa decumbens]|uniref:Uncharacterized protein n=1 Tax=Urochloa decumbens TaxID=240449 RepID=A0ABC8Y660_9POAL